MQIVLGRAELWALFAASFTQTQGFDISDSAKCADRMMEEFEKRFSEYPFRWTPRANKK